MQWLTNVGYLTRKEISSFLSDRILLGFLVLSFTFLIYNDATGFDSEVHNTSVAVVDGDNSALSRRYRDALLPPQFRPVVMIDRSRVDEVMDNGEFAFVLDIPPHLEADILRGKTPSLQLNIDATAMTLAGIGSAYIEEIILQETVDYFRLRGLFDGLPIVPVDRAMFNPNLEALWFQSVEALIEEITLFSLLLVGAAVIRERELGTIEHLLVMPLRASEIAASKVLANGIIVICAVVVALTTTLGMALNVPIQGSIPLFLASSALYIFSITALGIMLSTVAGTMPQFGLLVMPVFLVLRMLSGSTSPMESMPGVLRTILQASPTVHFVDLSRAVLFRNAGLQSVWPQILFISALGVVFFAIALSQFRRMLTRQH